MVKLVINGRPVEAEAGTTLLRAAQSAGIEIPHFCFHPAFPPEGSCRMCLVEIAGLPKLELACSTAVREGMKVTTDSEPVREARKSVLEFILTEHPLDCPICDKAGECRLQDYSRDYGRAESAFFEVREKRVKKAEIGEKLLLDRERCILCSRCVRFLISITGTRELGLFERGIRTEVDIYDGTPVRNGYSGNLVDLCPVGAITDRTFRFRTRAWFLEARPTLCPGCGRGCSLWADYHPGFPRIPGSARIFRVRPRENPEVNGHWICDFGRYGALDMLRDRTSGVRKRKNRPEGSGWEAAISRLAEAVRSQREKRRAADIALILSSRLTNEDLFLARKVFVEGLGTRRIAFADPPEGEGDAILLKPSRTPNAQGARILGFDPAKKDFRGVLEGASCAWIFGAEKHGLAAAADLQRLLGGVGTSVLVAPQACGLETSVDWTLAAAPVFEKGGSFTNDDGLTQSFSPVHPPCEEVRPESEILLGLGKALGLPGRLFQSAAVAENASVLMEAEYPALRRGGR